MEKYIPDIYQQSIYTINYEELSNRGIKCLLFDLDNTLVSPNIKKPNKRLYELFAELKKMDFKLFVFSNSPKKRVKIFSEKLGIPYYYSTFKPFMRNFKKVMFENDLDINEVAIIGDQLLTDILGGNRVGITTILINPVSTIDPFGVRINRFIERILRKKFLKYDLFILGKYYD